LEGQIDIMLVIKDMFKKALHSALGYRPPNRVEETYNLSRKTPLKSA